jgi:tetratricopeptide (TPR) repeat protein
VLLTIVTMQAASAHSADKEYREYCLYHYQRHERCGRWLKQNTQPAAVIATHDVGAIAYYSERKIVDVAGLIHRDAIPHLHKPDYTDFLGRLFQREKVTHLAFLENWIEVANQEPLWVADERPEVLSVYTWIPGRTLLVPERVTALNEQSVQLAMGGDLAMASRLLQRSLRLGPTNSRSWFLLGAVLEKSGNAGGAERAYRTALELFPDHEDARYALGALLAEKAGARRHTPRKPQLRS